MAFRYLDSLSGQTWAMLGGAGVVASSCGLGYKVWVRREKTKVLKESDCVATVEVSRDACTVLNGFDVVIRNYFYKETPVGTPLGTQLRNMLPIWLRSDTESGNLMSSSAATDAEKHLERNRLAATRRVQPKDAVAEVGGSTRAGDAGRPRRVPLVVESVWPVGTSRYCGMTIEPSLGPVHNADGDAALRRVERGALRAMIDRSTQQTLVKCRSNVAAVATGGSTQMDLCESDPTFLSAPYLRTMLGAFGLLPFPLPALRVCFLGVGGGALPMFLQQHFASKILHMDLVDVEPQVLRSAAQHMGLRQLVQSAPLACHAKDAHAFLSEKHDTGPTASSTSTASAARPRIAAPGTYDMIFVDVFVGSETPEHLQSEGFLHAVRSSLSAVGVATFNMPASNKAFVQSCEDVFGKDNLFVAPCRHSANNVLFAMRRKANEGLSQRYVLKRCRELSNVYHIPYDLPAHFPLWWSVV